MKIFERYLLWILLFVGVAIILSGYNKASSSSNTFGSPVSKKEITPIVDLFDHPDKFDGKSVTLKGTITIQDEKGYGFYLQDEDARIYVDLFESGFNIPSLTNKVVFVEGKVEVKLKIPSLLAKGVEYT
jgi:uncharacterized protein YdeI (BOF family)